MRCVACMVWKAISIRSFTRVTQVLRWMMLERQRGGIAKAKADSKYKACKPTARAKTDMLKLVLDKGISKAQICRDLDISKTSLYGIISELRGWTMSEDIITSYLLILVGFMAFFAGYLDMTRD